MMKINTLPKEERMLNSKSNSRFFSIEEDAGSEPRVYRILKEVKIIRTYEIILEAESPLEAMLNAKSLDDENSSSSSMISEFSIENEVVKMEYHQDASLKINGSSKVS